MQGVSVISRNFSPGLPRLRGSGLRSRLNRAAGQTFLLLAMGLACRRSVDRVKGDVVSAERGSSPDCGLSVRSSIDEDWGSGDIPFLGVVFGDFDGPVGSAFRQDWQVAPSGPAVVEVVDCGMGFVGVDAGPPLALGAIDAVDEVAGAHARFGAEVAA